MIHRIHMTGHFEQLGKKTCLCADGKRWMHISLVKRAVACPGSGCHEDCKHLGTILLKDSWSLVSPEPGFHQEPVAGATEEGRSFWWWWWGTGHACHLPHSRSLSGHFCLKPWDICYTSPNYLPLISVADVFVTDAQFPSGTHCRYFKFEITVMGKKPAFSFLNSFTILSQFV